MATVKNVNINGTVSRLTGGIYDVSEENNGKHYSGIAEVLSNNASDIPQNDRFSGMTIQFIRDFEAIYSVVRTDSLSEEPTGTNLDEIVSIQTGTYKESELNIVFETLPDTIGTENSVTYYVSIVIDEDTSYTSWVITKNENSYSEYVQYRLMSAEWSNDASEWQGVDDDLEYNKNLLLNSTVKEKIDNIETNIGYYSKLNIGFYALNANQVAPNARTSTTNKNWRCLKIACYEGDRFIISTIGGQNAKAFALTDLDRNIYVINVETTFISNVEVTATKDGYLYVNCYAPYIKDFKLEVYPSTNIYNKISLLSEKTEQNKNEFDIFKNGYTTNIEGTLVQEGELIDINGEFVVTTSSGYKIYRYNVQKNQLINIKTAIIEQPTRRSFAYAYNNEDEPIGNPILETYGITYCDVVYRVELDDIDNICVYCHSSAIDKPEVCLINEDVDYIGVSPKVYLIETEIERIKDGIFVQFDGTFVLNGVISLSGEKIEVGDGTYKIFSYQVDEGDYIKIYTSKKPQDALRAFAYAYNGETPVEMIADNTQYPYEGFYEVPNGVDNICVYCNVRVINYPIVRKCLERSIYNRVDKLEEHDSYTYNTVQEIENELLNMQKYNVDDCYVDGDGFKSYYYAIGAEGTTAPKNPSKFSNSDTYRCLKKEVYSGQIVSVKTKGANSGKAYAITDLNRVVLKVSEVNENTIENPFVYRVTQDGYLYSTCTPKGNFEKFEVIISYSYSHIRTQLDSLDNRLDIAEHEITGLKNVLSVSKIVNRPLDIHLQETTVPSQTLSISGTEVIIPAQTIKNKLRILEIGNSFSNNALAYVSGMVSAAGIDVSDMCLYAMTRGSGSFKTFYDSWHNQDIYPGTSTPSCHYGISKIIGGLKQTINGSNTLQKMHSCFEDNKWDLIIVHQVSTYSDDCQDWEGDGEGGYLKEFMRIIRTFQPDAAIGHLMAHVSFRQSLDGDTAQHFIKIMDGTKWLFSNYGVDFIIPVATAVENLRASDTFKQMYPGVTKGYSGDAHHLALGLGKYVAGAAYFQTIFGKRYGVSVYGNTYRVNVTEEEAAEETYPGDNISVTDDNAKLAQLCAILACNDMYTITNLDNIAETIDYD